MKIQVDLDEALWAEFKAKVNDSGKTLREVVPLVFEPAMRAYLEPPPTISENKFIPSPEVIMRAVENYTRSEPTPEPEPVFPPKRCDLCDKMVERRFFHNEQRICYDCWKGTLTAPVQ